MILLRIAVMRVASSTEGKEDLRLGDLSQAVLFDVYFGDHP